jgi:hypothetical protein
MAAALERGERVEHRVLPTMSSTASMPCG